MLTAPYSRVNQASIGFFCGGKRSLTLKRDFPIYHKQKFKECSMIETKITRMLGIQYPIIGGTMMWISDADFVAAISNAGGMGVLASAMYDSREAFAKAIDRLRELTDKPFAVNINLFPAMRQMDNNSYLKICAGASNRPAWYGFTNVSGYAMR
jgi:hypothetical protein